MHFVVDGWEIVPIVDAESVDSMLLFRIAPADPNASITAILVQREGESWTADAWAGVPRADALMWAVDQFGLPDPLLDPEQSSWTVEWIYQEAIAAGLAPDPEPYGVGLPLSHPLEPAVAGLEDPTVALEYLESVGEPVATGASVAPGSGIGIDPCLDGEGDPCLHSPEVIWEAIQQATLAELDEDDTGAQVLIALLQSGCCGCTPFTGMVRSLGCTGWTCGGWSTLIPWSNLGCSSNATFQRSATRTCRRRYIVIEEDCSFHRCVQSRTEQGNQVKTDTVEIPNCDYQAWIAGAPTAPTYTVDCDCNSNCGPSGSWVPPCP